jgi:hypothetical protein
MAVEGQSSREVEAASLHVELAIVVLGWAEAGDHAVAVHGSAEQPLAVQLVVQPGVELLSGQ